MNDTQLDKILDRLEEDTMSALSDDAAPDPRIKAKQALSDLMLDAVIEELQDLWTSGSSSHRDIRVGYDRGLTVHERIAELTAQKGRKEK